MNDHFPVPYSPPPRPLMRAGHLNSPNPPALLVRREPRLWAALGSIDGGGRSCLVTGVVCFAAGTILPLFLVGVAAICLVLGYTGSGAAAAPARPARSRQLAALPPLPTPQPLTPPTAPSFPTPPGLPGFSIEVIERDLVPPKLVTPAPVPKPASRPLAGWPATGVIKQGFGCSPYYTGVAGPGCPAGSPWFHDGLDIAAPAGTPVRASLAGTVIFAGPDGSGPLCPGGYQGYGLAVVIDNDAGWQALYAHLSRIDVTTKQVVTPDTVIGAVGDTGCVSGAHLHFGLRRDGILVDPGEVAGSQGRE